MVEDKLGKIEKIVIRIVGDVGEKQDIVGSIMSQVEWWPVWYYEQFNRKVDSTDEKIYYGNVPPTPVIQLLTKAVKSYVEDRPGTLDVDVATSYIVSMIFHWADWFWDSYEFGNASSYSEEENQYDSVYVESGYGDGDNGIGEF